jgi:methyl-accepting chemotaxis protein
MLKNSSIKAKLIFLTVISLLSLSFIITILTVKISQDAILNSKFQQLASIKSAKESEITSYFDSLKSLLTSLANHQGTIDAFLSFEEGFYKLKDEINLDRDFIKNKTIKSLENNYLNKVNYSVPNAEQRKTTEEYLPKDINGLIAQYIFIVDNQEKLGEKNNMTYNSKYDSSYMNAHKKYHKTFDAFLNSYSLYDIFMVDLKGNLIYTDFKEKDYATNLKNGIYKNTGIAKAYTKALNLNQGEVAFDDFKPYEPSYNSPASFISTPIFEKNKKIGVLIFQMPVDIINNIMQFNGKFKEAGLGESGETYLVGEDYKMRSNSRFQKDINDTLVQDLGTTIGIWEVKTKSVVNALKNEKGEWIIPDYRGINVLSAYSSINLFDQANWVIVSEIDEDEALSESKYIMYITISSSLLVSLIIILVTILLINKMILNPIKQFNIYFKEFVNFITQRVNRLEKREVKGNNEFSQMMHNMNDAVDDFNDRFLMDMKVMGETVLILHKIQLGIFNTRIRTESRSPMIMAMKNNFNSMLENLETTMNKIEHVILEYTDDNYTSKIDIPSNMKEKLLEVMNGVNKLGESLENSARTNLQNGQTLEKNSSLMKESMSNLSAKANEQAASIEETAASLEEITSLTRSNTQNSIKMLEFGNSVKTSVSKGQNLANKTAHSMEEINEKVSSINEAITVIDQIAFQTNILSLNAAVEAATAGEAGKGFAVVAQEVRNLASRSAEAAKEIKELVEEANVKANEGKTISSEMIEGYNTLNTQISQNINIIEEVTNASKEQMSGIEQINDSMTMLDRVTQENASEANQVTQIANDVSNLANSLVNDAKNKKFN